MSGSGNGRTGARHLEPETVFTDTLYGRLDWPGKTVRLGRDSLVDERHRSVSAEVSVAELYHENSKLFPQRVGELAASRVDLDDVRREYLQRMAQRASLQDNPPSGAALDEGIAKLLDALHDADCPELYYAIELRIVCNDALSSYDPLTRTTVPVRTLNGLETRRLHLGLRVLQSSSGPPWPTRAVFVLGYFMRYAVLLGSRGYRRTVGDAGQVARLLSQAARRSGTPIIERWEFADRDIDDIVEADGIEIGTIVVFELEDNGG